VRALARRRRPRGGFGAQAFESAKVFNANIGGWNTARVTTLYQVCAAPGPAARTMADALGRASMRRGRLCAAAPPMRARVRTRAGPRLRGALGVGTAARRGGSVRASEYIYILYERVCVCYTRIYTYIIHLSVHVRIGRGYVCVHQCAMGMDRLCAHALAGSCCGLGLKPETLNRASPCPSAWTVCGFGAQAFHQASAFNANIGAWNTAAVPTLYQVCAAPGPAARTMADALGRASVRRGRLCAAAPPMRARVRTRAGPRLRGAVGVGTAARRGGSVHASEYIYIRVCVCVLHAYTYIIHVSVYVRTGRGDVCVHQCAMVMDRLCARALAGSCCGLGLEPETLNRASPSRRRGPRAASARRRSSWRRRSTRISAVGTPRV
jgi:hypothetical protein